MILRPVLIAAAVAATFVPVAEAQAPSILGRWAGTANIGDGSQRIVYTITGQTVGQVVGTTRYRYKNRPACTDELTLVARQNGGFSLRARRTGPTRRCTDGDRIFVRRAENRLRVRLRGSSGSPTFRFTLKKL